MNETPTTSPRPKAKKNKIRPKLKPIVSTNEDDDEGLGYGEWAPSPLKPRQAPENNWSGSEEDEKKDEDTTIHVIKKPSPKVQPVSSEEEEVTKEVVRPESRLDARSNPTQSKRGFDNKLQLSESSNDGEEEKNSDNRASNNDIHTQQAANSSIENILLDESLQWLRSRFWKGFIVLLFIATSCEVLSIAIITKVRLSHVELSFNVNGASSDKESGIAAIEDTGVGEVLSLSKDENDEVPNVELIEVEDEAAEPTISKENMLPSEEGMLPVVLAVNDEQSDTKEEGQANELPEIELVKLEEDATGDDEHTVSEVDLSSEEVREGLESNDEQPSAQEDDESEAGMDEQSSDSSELEAEDNLPLSEEVRERLESNDVHHGTKKDEESEGGANGLPETDSDNLEAEERVLPSDEVHEGYERNDEQPIAKDDEGSESLAGANELPETDNKNLLSEEVREVFESNDEQPIATEYEESESDVSELPEADSSDLEAENYVLPPSEEVTVNEDRDANSALGPSDDEGFRDESDANEVAETYLVEVVVDDSTDNEQPEVVITPSVEAAEEVRDGFESDDEQPDAREDEQSEADVDEQASDSSEEYSSPPEEVTESDTIQALPVTIDGDLDTFSALHPLVDEKLVDESDANEAAETDLVEVEITVEDSDNDEQPELVVTPSEEADAEKESEIVSVEEVSASDEQHVANIDDAVMTSEEPESDEKEHATIETETTSEDGSDQHEAEGSPSLDDHEDNDREDTEHELQQQSPRTIETKREFLATLEKFEDTFESYEVIDALIGHVACAVPKLLVKRILGVATKVKGRFSKKQ